MDDGYQKRRDELVAGLQAIEAIRAGRASGPAPSILDQLPPGPAPEEPRQHDAHLFARLQDRARRETAELTAEHERNLAAIARLRFDHAQRNGERPFGVVEGGIAQ
ncbi:hypothetical protein [Azospirillum brasilense]|uniref:Uncharacterized protein n=1 Tax=Azospirillum brasilense TaxID=192 RepID=A0A6L3B654_AZOBR|nr:hypothetical protein [Azospirillum brasilense]KAA0688488.1 hypothetical protein DS837_01810 [Azospirillum brasilense]